MKIKYLLVFIIAVTIVSFGQDENKVLKNLQNRFESVNNLSADFLQSSSIPGNSKSITYKGKFFFEKKNKYRIEFRSSEVVCDGKTVWNYNRGKKKVVISNVDSDPSAFSLNSIVYDYPSQSNISSGGKETIDGKACNIILLKPKKSNKKFESAKLWIDDTNMIKKVEISDGNVILSFALSNIKLNQKISADKFKMTIPEGAETIDLR